jgi:hypothetical protein
MTVQFRYVLVARFRSHIRVCPPVGQIRRRRLERAERVRGAFRKEPSVEVEAVGERVVLALALAAQELAAALAAAGGADRRRRLVPEKCTQGIRLRRAELAREEAYGSHV